MTDPYSILGVSVNATEDEVKAAYKRLAQKYGRSQYENDPLCDFADKKMTEIDEAYDSIMTTLRMNSSFNDSESENFSYESISEYHDVRQLISSGRLDDAEQILDGVPQNSRKGEWNYLKGYILYKRGWLSEATNYVTRAREIDPSNQEYEKLYNTLTSPFSGTFGGFNQSGLSGVHACNICSSLICADLCCECMGGDLIPCC